MRLGVIAYSTNTGLGYQSASYVKYLNPTKILDINISNLNGMKHHSWYADARITNGLPSIEDCEWLTDDVDVILMAETPLNYELYKIAKAKGVKTINVINPEFYDHIKYPEITMPDVIILPSVWKEAEIRIHAQSKGTKVYQIHHPVDRDEFPFTPRKVARFIHIAGKPASNDRNGTWDFLKACPDGTVTTQSEDLAKVIKNRYSRPRILTNMETPQQIYQMGDVLVLPRRYGGNCLPLNEALSSGMPVIMPDIVPNNNILPKEWLVPATITGSFEPRTKVDIYSVDIQALANKLEYFRTIDIEQESYKANDIANSISWEALKDKYLEVINE